MSATRLALFSSLLLMLVASGCSGSRLRDLFPGNNRFVSLDDLDQPAADESQVAANDAAGDAAGGPFKTARGLFVSRERDEAEGDAAEATESSRGPLGLGALLGRSDKSKMEADPFLDVADPAPDVQPERTVTAQVTPKQAPATGTDKSAASRSSELPAGTEEALAEAFAEFRSGDSGSRAADSKAPHAKSIGTKNTDPAIRSVASESDKDGDAESFAAFVNRRFDDDRRKTLNGNQGQIDDAIAAFGDELRDTRQQREQIKKSASQKTAEARAEVAAAFDDFATSGTGLADDNNSEFVLDFDTLLADTQPESKQTTPSSSNRRSSDFSFDATGSGSRDRAAFALLAADDEDAVADMEFDELVAEPLQRSPAPLVRATGRDLFAAAAARHGFTGESVNRSGDAWEPADVDAFEWQHPSTDESPTGFVDAGRQPAWPDEFAVDRTTVADRGVPVPNVVPAGRASREFAAFGSDVEAAEPIASAPLVIPGLKTKGSAVTRISTSRNLGPDFDDEPFFDGTAAVAVSGPAGNANADSQPSGATGGISLLRKFSGRTWFLLVGILAVIALLFFPERRIRKGPR